MRKIFLTFFAVIMLLLPYQLWAGKVLVYAKKPGGGYYKKFTVKVYRLKNGRQYFINSTHYQTRYDRWGNNFATVSGIKPNTPYLFRVIAKTGRYCRIGKWRYSKWFKTKYWHGQEIIRVPVTKGSPKCD